MVEPTPETELEVLIATARAAEPPHLGPMQARRMVKVALEQALRRPRGRRRLLQLSAAAVACVAALTFVWLSPRSTAIELAPDAVPLRLSLKTGDSLVIAAGTRLRVLDDAAPKRAIELEHGTVLFDVPRLGTGQLFEVHTRAALVRVLGTVFSVAVEAGRTSVHVHEGKVAVGGRTLGANQAWSSSGTISKSTIPFASEARAFVLARAPAASRAAEPSVAPSAPVVSALPAEREGAASTLPDAAWPRSAKASAVQPGGARPEAEQSAGAPERDWFEHARAELARGQAERALSIASEHGERAEALRLAADALRTLGRFEEALVQYELAALRASGELRVQAGYGAAQLALSSLQDATRALALIERFRLDHDDSALRERASLLRIEALLASGDKSTALSAARRYLEREPATATSERLRTLFEGAL